jgi:hypothetical protein
MVSDTGQMDGATKLQQHQKQATARRERASETHKLIVTSVRAMQDRRARRFKGHTPPSPDPADTLTATRDPPRHCRTADSGAFKPLIRNAQMLLQLTGWQCAQAAQGPARPALTESGRQ